MLAVGCAVGLLTTAGYLISRAAEQPPILSLTTTIVAVRFFGLARPVARYLERLASHDVALRSLGRLRTHFYERIEPLAPGQLEGYRRGELLGRLVGDVDALQGLYVRGVTPPLVALVVGTACVGVTAAFLPAAAAVLAAGLLLAGAVVPALAAAVSRAAGRRQAAVRAELTAELVELLRGAPELVVYGREAEALARVRARSDELARLSRRDALSAGVGEGLSILIAGATVAGVLAVAADASIDRVLVATLALLALASFDSVTPLLAAARELSATTAAGRRVLELVDREPAVRDPAEPRTPPGAATVALEGVTARYAPDAAAVLSGFDLRLEPGRRVALVGPSGAGKTTVANLLLRFLDPEVGRVTIGGYDLRALRQHDVRRTFALAGQDAHVFNSTIRANLAARTPGARADEALLGALAPRPTRRAGSHRSRAAWTRSSARRARSSRAASASVSTIARALLTDAPVLVLDEPTAHLDPETAEALVSDVLTAAGERSVLLITHRPEGLDLVDEIVVLQPAGASSAA